MNTQIREYRQHLGMSLQEAAGQLGTNPGNLSRIERGIQLPSIGLARRISAMFGMTLDEIYIQDSSNVSIEDKNRVGYGNP
jgi:DNA-binding XRE family transcriptional regulator